MRLSVFWLCGKGGPDLARSDRQRCQDEAKQSQDGSAGRLAILSRGRTTVQNAYLASKELPLSGQNTGRDADTRHVFTCHAKPPRRHTICEPLLRRCHVRDGSVYLSFSKSWLYKDLPAKPGGVEKGNYQNGVWTFLMNQTALGRDLSCKEPSRPQFLVVQACSWLLPRPAVSRRINGQKRNACAVLFVSVSPCECCICKAL